MTGTTPHIPAPGLRIAVINLARAEDRRARMAAMFDDIGLDADFFPALDMLDADVRAKMDALPERGPWVGFFAQDKACALSHLAVMDDFLAGEATHCLVMEDDIFAARDLPLWTADLSWFPGDADIVKLEKWLRKSGPLLLGAEPQTHLNRSIARLYSRHQGGAGYIVSRKGAQKVLSEPATIDASIDHWLFNPEGSPLARKLVTYQVWPALVKQGNEPPRKTGAPPRIDRQQNKLLRELRRLRVKTAFLPTALGHRLSGRAEPRLIDWADTTNHTAATAAA